MQRARLRNQSWQSLVRRGTVRDLAALALLLALCLFFFWPVLTLNPANRGSFRSGDFYVQSYACGTYKARELLSGNIPLWNPHVFSGHPYLADIQNATLYPLSILTILLSAPWGYSVLALELEAIAHVFLGAAFTYFLGRRLFRRRGVALVVAVIFAFGGYLTSFPILQLPILETAIWLPLLLLLLDLGIASMGETPSKGILYCILSGAVFAVALFAGNTQTAMYLFYVTLIWYLFRATGADRRPRLPLLVGFLVFVVTAGGLAAVQLIPALELTRLSTRASAAFQDIAGGLSIKDLLQIVLPGATGYWKPLYVGIIPLTLALFALAIWFQHGNAAPSRRWRRNVGFWFALASISLLLSLGSETFLYDLFYLGVPGFDLFRRQERVALVFSLSVAVLSGYGLCHLMTMSETQGRDAARAILYRLNLALLLGVGGLGLLLFFGATQGGEQGQLMSDLMGLAFFVGLLTVGGWLWSAIWTNRIWRSGPVLGLLLALIVFDLFTVNARTNVQSRHPERQVLSTPIIDALRSAEEDKPFRVHHGGYYLMNNYGCVFDLEDTIGASQLQLADYARFLEQVPQEYAWELLNVRYAVTWQAQLSVPSQEVQKTTTRQGEDVYLHRLDKDAPRAWAAFRTEVVSDDQALARLSQPDFDRLGVALLDAPLDPPLTEAPTGQARLHLTRHTAEHLSLEVEMPARGLVILSELHYPGWSATVDGQRVPVRPVDMVLQAIEVPAGFHRIEVKFRPVSFYLGMVLSLLSLFLLSGYTIGYIWRRRVNETVEDELEVDQE